MKKLKMTVAILAAAAVAGPAFANGHSMKGKYDEPVVETRPAPPPTPVYDWTGGYAGIAGGFGEARGGGFSDSDLVYGVFAGYNHQAGNMVFGGELELGSGNFSVAGVGLDYLARIKGRVGVAQDNVLVYGVGGVAYASLTNASDWGYFGGIGVEVGMGNNWFGGMEATHHRFNDFDGSGVNARVNVLTARVGFRF